MTTQHPSRMTTRIIVVFVTSALMLSACGSGTTSVQASPIPAPDARPEIPAPGDHQYGATLEQWAETEQAQAATGATNDAADAVDAVTTIDAEVTQIVWEDLIPQGSSGEEIMARFKERIDRVEIGSPQALELYDEIEAEFDPEAVNEALDGQKIRLAGFVAPLTFDNDIVTEFLLVPTFGACIHVPPPPPNQTVMVTVDASKAFTLEDAWGAVWVEGTLVIEPATTDLAAASYKIVDARSGVYNEF